MIWRLVQADLRGLRFGLEMDDQSRYRLDLSSSSIVSPLGGCDGLFSFYILFGVLGFSKFVSFCLVYLVSCFSLNRCSSM